MVNVPLFAGNPQLQEQLRLQLPVFLQQVKASGWPCAALSPWLQSFSPHCGTGRISAAWLSALGSMWAWGAVLRKEGGCTGETKKKNLVRQGSLN